MNERPRPVDGFRAWTLHRWYILFWVFLGLIPMMVAGKDAPGATKIWTMGLPAVPAVCYLIMRAFPANRVLRPDTFVWVLVVALGAMSYIREGGATAYVATLPHFWFLVRDPRSSIWYSGVAAAVTALAGIAPQGWSPELFTGNVVATLAAYAVSVPLGLSVYRYFELSDERVRVLGTELELTQLRLAEAHRRQGATDERERLAREIHDTLAQGFASIVVLAEAARSGLTTDAARSAQQLHSIEQTARENLAEARVLVGSAPQSGVVPGSVASALRRTLDRFTEDTGLTVDADLSDVECDQQTRIALLRCTQESLANVRKHAGASTVGVVLAGNPYGVELEITDDGRGFVIEDAGGFGLVGMRNRMAELGGEFTVTSSIGDGTRVLAVIPTNGQV
jgi:signal transduction histidine kinase